ncbi:MAG: TIGR00730 family Rossman fold protein [Paracoccaceae bacterium]|nr:TIGR00730 family Rossman fold protein [Paracoccaceae bacterium]MDE2916926.1 TIGR00730 family Rossman fold protein [Paracoccaceae bacterium]
MKKNKITKPEKTICVFCGSRPGKNPGFIKMAEKTGAAIASEGWTLLYGAGSSGLMGTAAKSAMDAGGKVIGVIPSRFPEEVLPNLYYTIKTTTIQERKSVMFNCSDAIVVLPGGIGTLEEFFEVLTWKQLGWHDKPVILFSFEGYWDNIPNLVANIVDNEFAEADSQKLYLVERTLPDLISRLRESLSSRSCPNE